MALSFNVYSLHSDSGSARFTNRFNHRIVVQLLSYTLEKNEPQIVTEATEISIVSDNYRVPKKEVFIGGYDKELEIIFKQIKNTLKSYTGFLIYGPSGCGKSLLAQAVISKLEGYKLVQINGSEVYR